MSSTRWTSPIVGTVPARRRNGSTQHTAQHPLFPSMARPTNSRESDMASEEHLSYWNSPSPSSYSMVLYQGSGQSSMDNPQQNQQQRSTNGGESDMATEDPDVMSFLNLPQSSPPPRSRSPSNSMVLYRGSDQLSMDNQLRHYHQHQDYVDRPWPYIAQDWNLFREKLLELWTNESDKRGPIAGIMPMNKEGLPQSPERLGISLMTVYVEDRLDTLLYWQGESWPKVYTYMECVSKLFPGEEYIWFYPWEGRLVKSYGNGLLATPRVTMGVWRTGHREWMAKIRYHSHSLPRAFFNNDQSGGCMCREVYFRKKQVQFEEARSCFPDLDHVFPAADSIEFSRTKNPDTVGIGDEGIEGAEIAEPQLSPGPSGKRKKTPRNVITLEKILQVEEMRRLKDAAKHLNVGKSTMKRTCRKHGINRWQPRNKYKGVTQSLPNETPAVVDQEGIPQGERATNKSTGVRIDITLEEILQCERMRRKDAATRLKVSESTLKRICRTHNIPRWPPRRVDKHINQSLPNKSPSVVDQEQIRQSNFATVLRSNQASIETNSVTIKAKYETLTIKFRLSRPWQKVELEEQVKMRLRLEVGTYYIEYKDEDGELILIGCDEDLKDCIPSSSPMGTCSIVLFLRQSSS